MQTVKFSTVLFLIFLCAEKSKSFPNALHEIAKRQTPLNAVSTLQSTCGTSVSGRPLVYGGKPADKGKFPWAGALFADYNGWWKYQCSSTLVTYSHVITAAHCLEFPSTYRSISPNQLKVLLGTNDLSTINETGSALMQVKSIHVHPDFEVFKGALRTAHGDIAIIGLKGSVQITKVIRPICLWPQDSAAIPLKNAVGVVAGWGMTEDGGLSDILKEIDIPIVSTADCLWSDEAFRFLTSNRTLCAGSRNGVGPCSGDSGSGLILQHNSRMYLTGVVSTSVANGEFKCDLNKYVVYADATKFRSWIGEILKLSAHDNSRIIFPNESSETTTSTLVENNSYVETRDNDNRTELIVAVRNGNLGLVKSLLARAANVEARDNYNWNALMYGAMYGHVDIVKELLEKGADIEAKDNDYRTALISAVKYAKPEIVKTLISKGANMDARDVYNWNALMYCAQHGHVDIVKELLEKGADIEAKDNDYRTALISAVRYAKPEIVKTLINKGANMEARDKYNWNALMYCAQYGHADIARILLDKGVNIEAIDGDKRTSLTAAVRFAKGEFVEFLLEKGANVNARDRDNWTALSWAKYNGHSKIVEMLLKKGGTE